jgi:hypothetical protein
MTLIINYLQVLSKKIDISTIFPSIKLELLTTWEQIKDLLELRKNDHAHAPTLSEPEINLLEKRLTNYHWYLIASNSLLPIQQIIKKRDAIYKLIKHDLKEPQRKRSIEAALDPTTPLGQFFAARPHFMGVFKPLQVNYVSKLNKLQQQYSRPPNHRPG